MSALYTATAANARASANAAIHIRNCPICPRSLGDFLDRRGRFCEAGKIILRTIAATEQDIADAVARPMYREIPS